MRIPEEILSRLTLDDIPAGITREIAAKIGLEPFLLLYEEFSMLHIYIPDDALKPFKRRMVNELWSSYNPKELARMLHLSEREVYRIRESDRPARHEQLPLFPGEKRKAGQAEGENVQAQAGS